MAVRVKTKWTLTSDTTANLRPPTPSGTIFQTYGNHQMIDWWEWSHDPANGDLFGVAARANGTQYWCSTTATSGTGSQGSPFSPNQLKSAIENRSLAANAVVNMAAGNYAGTNLCGGENQMSGGGGNGGWITLLGPPAGQGVAECRVSSGHRGWSLKGSASRIQFVRIHAEHTTLNSAFANYVNGGGGLVFNTSGQFDADAKMTAAIGQNVQAIGFQLSGSEGHPGPVFYVNCSSRGWGEGFGTFQAGNAFALGCVAWECGRASPNGRSCFSFSWYNSGYNNQRGNTHLTSALVTGSGVDYYGGTFGCLAYDAFQLHPSTGINLPAKITDGNGFILPTDATIGNEQGRFIQQANIAYRVSGAAGTGFNESITGVDMINNTYFATGYNNAHRQGINPFGLPIQLVDSGVTGDGPPLLLQRYDPPESTVTTSGNVAINGDYDGRSLQAWGDDVTVPGRGNVYTGAWTAGSGAILTATGLSVSRGTVINSESPDPNVADANLKAGSPAIGAAWIADAPFKIDFMGRPLVDRGAGKTDAGALQRI